MNRREFDKRTKVAIVKRSMIEGIPTCERVENEVRCGCTKGLEVNHIDMDAMQVDKSRKLTANDGENICQPHHKRETKTQMGVLANTLRMEAAALGADKPNKAKIAQPAKSPKTTFKQDQIRALREARFR
jgi:hypothetical protein